MSIPKKHHFLPEFYLKRWASPGDQKIVEYRRPRPHLPVSLKRVFPSETGYIRELYSIPTRREPARRQELESGFMSPLDNAAANALAALEDTGLKPSDPSHVNAWARFVLSLLNRSPRRLDWLLVKLLENDDRVSALLEGNYDRVRGPNDPATYVAYQEAVRHPLVYEHRAELIRQMVGSDWLRSHIASMVWRVHTIEHVTDGLLTGDEPIITSNGIGEKYGFIALPVGPNRLFFAANNLPTIQSFLDQPLALENGFNDAVIRQSRWLAIGSNDQYRTFVDARLGKEDPASGGGYEERMTWNAPLRDP